jgi:tetratricopeptide (TPR) repeat protein
MKRLIVPAVLLAFLVSGTAAHAQGKKPDPKKAELYVKEGLKKLKERTSKSVQLAAQFFRKALQYDPKNITALVNLAYIMQITREAPGRIIKAYKEVLKIIPDHQTACFYIAEEYIKMKRFDAALPFLTKAVKSKRGLLTAPGSDQPDPMLNLVVKVYYGQCLAETGKGDKALEVLRPLAQEGKFENFMGHKDEFLRQWAWKGYLVVGEALSELRYFKEADGYLRHCLEIQKKMMEGKVTKNAQDSFLRNLELTPAYGQWDRDRNGFVNDHFKVSLVAPKGWDFTFVHPELYQSQEHYDSMRRRTVAGVVKIHKAKGGDTRLECEIHIEAIDPSTTNYTIGGKMIVLESPKSATETLIEARKPNYVDITDFKWKKKIKFKTRSERKGFRAGYYQWTGKLARNKDIKRDFAEWVVSTRKYTFFIEISGPAGSRKKYYKDIQALLYSMVIKFR